MNQAATLTVPSVHRMSLLLSPLWSPVWAICRAAGALRWLSTTSLECHSSARSRRCQVCRATGCRRSRCVEITDAGHGPIQRHRAEIYRLLDMAAVHHPQADIARRRVAEENVAVHVRADDGPIRGQLANDGGLYHLRAVHEPDAEIAILIYPENIGLAVAVEIAGAATGQLSGTAPGTAACTIWPLFTSHMPRLQAASRRSMSP